VFGAHALVLPQKGSAQINEEAMKASAGALSNISICREKSLVSAIGFLQMSGIQVFASDLKAEKQIFELDWTQPAAVVVGSEGEGVSASVLRQVNQNFIIPQKGQTDSLNVSVAAGVILYEIVRQRMKG
ncbi:MAG: RNA methyltransferase, partial [Bacteroidetes bacterium]